MNLTAELKRKLLDIPELPGIYKMLDFRGNVIYIGKSKCLKKRVKTYFTGNHKGSRTEKLVSFINDLDYIVTDTHLEAKLLECQLIKEIKPMFNSQMKNDQGYVYLTIIQEYNPYKALSVEFQRNEYSYGPFRKRYTLNSIADGLMNIFPVSKKNNEYEFRFNPIPLPMDQGSFYENKKILIELFSDTRRMDSFIRVLEDKMNESAVEYKFEEASKYRDIIRGLNYIKYRIRDYADFLSRDYLLKIPTIKGTKLFLVSRGYILYKGVFSDPTKAEFATFINSGYLMKSMDTKDEKAAMDYHDIIYSEIKSLPKDWYEIIPTDKK